MGLFSSIARLVGADKVAEKIEKIEEYSPANLLAKGVTKATGSETLGQYAGFVAGYATGGVGNTATQAAGMSLSGRLDAQDAERDAAEAQKELARLNKDRQERELIRSFITEQARQTALSAATGQQGTFQSVAGTAAIQSDLSENLEFLERTAELGETVSDASLRAAEARETAATGDKILSFGISKVVPFLGG